MSLVSSFSLAKQKKLVPFGIDFELDSWRRDKEWRRMHAQEEERLEQKYHLLRQLNDDIQDSAKRADQEKATRVRNMVYFFIWGDIKGLNAEQIVTKAGQHIEESIGGAAQK